MKSKISIKGRPTAYDRDQHMLICAALGVSRSPTAPTPTAYAAVKALQSEQRSASKQDTNMTLLHLYLELDNLAFHLGAAPEISAALHGLAERAKSLIPSCEHP
jgi:hypothetical protein